jgi:hypothetical protein
MNTETRRLYTRHQQRWIEWCASQGLDPVTPPADRIAGYIRELGAAFARSTVQQHCAAIMAYHRAAGVETSPVQSFTMRHVLRDIHHASKKPQGKLPLNSYNLRRIMAPESPSPNRLKLLRDRALFALGGYFRAGELFQLETSHIVAASTSAMTFRLGDKSVVIDNSAPGYAISHLVAWLKESGIVTGLLLRNVTRGGRVGSALAQDSGRRRLKEMLAEAGVRPERYSLQSLLKGRTSVESAAPHRAASVARARQQPAGVPFETIAAIWQVVPEAPQ